MTSVDGEDDRSNHQALEEWEIVSGLQEDHGSEHCASTSGGADEGISFSTDNRTKTNSIQSVIKIIEEAHNPSARAMDALLEWSASNERQKSLLNDRLSLFSKGLVELCTMLNEKCHGDSAFEKLAKQLLRDVEHISSGVADLKGSQHELGDMVYAAAVSQSYLMYTLQHASQGFRRTSCDAVKDVQSSLCVERDPRVTAVLERYYASVGALNIATERIDELDATLHATGGTGTPGTDLDCDQITHRANLVAAWHDCKREEVALREALPTSSLESDRREDEFDAEVLGVGCCVHRPVSDNSTGDHESMNERRWTFCHSKSSMDEGYRDAHTAWANQFWAGSSRSEGEEA